MCEYQDGLDTSITVLVILNLVIAVAVYEMHVVEGSLVSVFSRWFIQFCLDISASYHTKVLYTKLTPGV
jgi:hypothetical protein